MSFDPAHDEVQLPRPALEVLVRSATRDRAGTGLALREAGRAAGSEIAGRIEALSPASGIGASAFWAAVNAETVARGLGTIRWASRSDAASEVVAVDAVDVIAAGTRTEEPGPARPEAPFSEGFVEGLLSRVAGEPVGSLAVDLREAGGAFSLHLLVGSPTFLRIVRRRLDSGADLGKALEES